MMIKETMYENISFLVAVLTLIEYVVCSRHFAELF
jgi:hypothetical protein